MASFDISEFSEQILSTANLGLWIIEIDPDAEPRMYAESIEFSNAKPLDFLCV